MKIIKSLVLFFLLIIILITIFCRKTGIIDLPLYRKAQKELSNQTNTAFNSYKPPSDDLPDICVIVLDTVRFDFIFNPETMQTRQPALADIIAASRIYKNAYSTSSWTMPAHVSIMSGFYPNKHKADQINRQVSRSFPYLPELLSMRGYMTVGFTENPMLGRGKGFERGFSIFLDTFKFMGYQFLKDLDWLPSVIGFSRLKTNLSPKLVDTICSDGRFVNTPLFLFVNLISPHRPYRPLPENYHPQEQSLLYYNALLIESKYDVPKWYLGIAPRNNRNLDVIRDIYKMEVAEACLQAKKIIESMQKRNRKKIIFVVSDHGENFGEAGHLDHVFALNQPLVKIVMFVTGDGIKPEIIEEPVSLIDIFPTVLHLADAQVPENSGNDLFKPLSPDRALFLSYSYPLQVLNLFKQFKQGKISPKLASYMTALYAIIKGGWKLNLKFQDEYHLFNIENDNNETNDLFSNSEQISLELKNLIDLYRKTDKDTPVQPQSPMLDEQTRNKLKSLGYID